MTFSIKEKIIHTSVLIQLSVAVVTIGVFIHERWTIFKAASYMPVFYLTG